MQLTLTISRLAVLLLSLGLALPLQAEPKGIEEISSTDLGMLAQQNSRNNKQTMLIYYEDNCAWCDQFASTEGAPQEQGYRLYKTNVNSGFNVTCPNGEYLSDREFMHIKGITQLPAAVITDNKGNVIHVQNGLRNTHDLVVLMQQHRQRQLAHQ